MTVGHGDGFAIGVVLALVCGGTAAFGAPDTGFSLRIELSGRAAALLAVRHEEMVMIVEYYGWPKTGAERLADEMGRIDFGPDRLIGIPGRSGQYAVPQVALEQKQLAALKGPLYVNVNIASARRADPDNLLSCETLDAPLTGIRKAVPVLHCDLIADEG